MIYEHTSSGFSSSVLLVGLLAALYPFPALSITVLVVLNLRVINTVRITPASLSAGVLRHHPASHRCLAGDARLGEQSLILLELPVPLVLANVRLCSCQVSAATIFIINIIQKDSFTITFRMLLYLSQPLIMFPYW